MSERRIDRKKPEPARQDQPYPDWQTIKRKVTPGMLGPRTEPEPNDWRNIIGGASDVPDPKPPTD